MKKFKKVLICAAACATACSMTALAACTDGTPSDKLSADVTVAESMSTDDLGVQIAKFENVTSSSFTLDGGLNVVKLEGGVIPGGVPIATISAKGNLEDGDADINLSLNSGLFENGSGQPSAIAEGGEEEGEGGEESGFTMVEMNVFLRGWKVFYQELPGSDSYGYQDLAELFSEATAGTSVSGMLADVMTEGFGGDFSQLLKLANTTDAIAVSESEHTISLNINKMVYGLYNYVRQIVNNITVNTTLSGLMQCSAVKYYVETFTEGMTAQDLFETVMQALAGGNGSGAITPFLDVAESSPLTAVLPLQNESVYDYIVRLLNSEDVATLMGSETTLGSTKIADLLGEDAKAALDSLKATVNSLLGTVITEDAIYIPSEGGMESALAGTAVSDLTLTYTFTGQDVLQSVSLTGNITADMDGEAEMELSLTVTFLGEKVTEFTDISAYEVVFRDGNNEIVETTTAGALLGGGNEEE